MDSARAWWAAAVVASAWACGGKAVIDGYPGGAGGLGGDGSGGQTTSTSPSTATQTTTTGSGAAAGYGGSGGVGGCGGGVAWVWTAGGDGDDQAEEVAVDPSGNIVVVGYFEGTLALPGTTLTSQGGEDAFVVGLDREGALRFAHAWGDSANQRALGVAVGEDGSVLVAGAAAGSFDVGTGALQAEGAEDAFVAKLDSAGVAAWARLVGSAARDAAEDVAVAPDGRVAIAGSVDGDADFGSGTLPFAGGSDAFIAWFDAAGAPIIGRLYGDAGVEQVTSIDFDSTGALVATGNVAGPIDFGGGPIGGEGATDSFVVKLDPSGNHAWSSAFGNAQIQEGFAVAVDGQDAVLLTGLFEGEIDFAGSTLQSVGARDMYLVKLDPSGASQWAERFGDGSIDSVRHVDVTRSDDVVLTGPAAGYTDFGCGAVGGDDGDPMAFVAKLDAAGAPRFAATWANAPWAPAYSHQYAMAAADDGAGGLIVIGMFTGNLLVGEQSFDAELGNDWFVLRLAGLP